MKKSLIALLFASFFSGATLASAESAIAGAEAAQKAVANVGYEWRDTARMINEAKKLAGEGNAEKATKIAKIAEKQAVRALEQYHSELKRYSQQH